MSLRAWLIGLFVLALLSLVLFLSNRHPGTPSSELAQYYIRSFTADTGARNAVAAIYLNYRIYDTIFEALILLTAIIGMLHFFRIGGEK